MGGFESIVGVDIGLSGGISDGEIHHDMPVVLFETKPAVKVLNLKNGKKQFYKSGPLVGTPVYRIKTAAKQEKQLDLVAISVLFNKTDIIVFESPGISMGNAAKSSATTNRNFGKLLACAELCSCKIVTVTPRTWKKDLELSKDKMDSIKMAEKLSGKSFITSRGRLIDGPAEAFLLRHWYLKSRKDK